MPRNTLSSIDATLEALKTQNYIASEEIASAVFLACQLGKPLLVEGPPGVGKTELAKALAQSLSAELIRLQCYEGLDESKALYEWKYGKQLLYTQILKEKLDDIVGSESNLNQALEKLKSVDDIFFSPDFLEPRPLLQALQSEKTSVLLIDEIDKSDEEFEALLLEILSDFQVTVPEIGTIVATNHPLVILTSNSTRELSDALKRRCLHLFIPFPEKELEQIILLSRVPELSQALSAKMANFIDRLRDLELKKQPAVSETIDWGRALLLLHANSLDANVVSNTLNLILKHQEDIDNVRADLDSLLKGI
ncbi:MAG: MoxR-like ATPase [Pseudomonadales bacterium]|jgi:MoxR-like ATPase